MVPSERSGSVPVGGDRGRRHRHGLDSATGRRCRHAAEMLAELGVAARGARRLGAPHARRAVRLRRGGARRGLRAIIAGAGGAAHLPGMLAAKTTVPVLGVPVPVARHSTGSTRCSRSCRCPRASRSATFAIGEAGAANAALFAVGDARHRATPRSRESLDAFRAAPDGTACSTAAAARRARRRSLPAATLGVLGGGQLGRMFVARRAPMGYRDRRARPRRRRARPARSPTATSSAAYDDPPRSTSSPACAVGHHRVRERAGGRARALAARVPVRPARRGRGSRQDRIAREGVPRAPRLRRRAVRGDRRRPTSSTAVAATLVPGDPQDRPARLRRQGPGAVDDAARRWRPRCAALGGVPCVLEQRLAAGRARSRWSSRAPSPARSRRLPGRGERAPQRHPRRHAVPARRCTPRRRGRRAIAVRHRRRRSTTSACSRVEFFVLPDGALLVNEIAPRPHNSGHYSSTPARPASSSSRCARCAGCRWPRRDPPAA